MGSVRAFTIPAFPVPGVGEDPFANRATLAPVEFPTVIPGVG